MRTHLATLLALLCSCTTTDNERARDTRAASDPVAKAERLLEACAGEAGDCPELAPALDEVLLHCDAQAGGEGLSRDLEALACAERWRGTLDAPRYLAALEHRREAIAAALEARAAAMQAAGARWELLSAARCLDPATGAEADQLRKRFVEEVALPVAVDWQVEGAPQQLRCDGLLREGLRCGQGGLQLQVSGAVEPTAHQVRQVEGDEVHRLTAPWNVRVMLGRDSESARGVSTHEEIVGAGDAPQLADAERLALPQLAGGAQRAARLLIGRALAGVVAERARDCAGTVRWDEEWLQCRAEVRLWTGRIPGDTLLADVTFGQEIACLER